MVGRNWLAVATLLLAGTARIACAAEAVGNQAGGAQPRGAALPGAPTGPDGFHPSLGAAVIYVDNIDQAPPSTPTQSDIALQATPGVRYQYTGQRLITAVDYSLQAIRYRDRDDLNAVYQNGSANAWWQISPNFFFVDGWIDYQQQVADPTQPGSSNNLFNSGNTANRLSIMLAPTLQHDFGQTTAMLRALGSTSQYSASHHNPLTATLQDSWTRAFAGSIASNDAGALFTWDASADSSRTTFDLAAPFEDDRTSLDGSVRLIQSLRLLGGTGVETNVLKSSSRGGLDSWFWSLGFKWTPSERDELDVQAGHRFFGTSYAVSWSHQSRIALFTGSYTEAPTTTGLSDALADFTPGQIPNPPQAYATVLRSSSSYSPFLAKSATVGLVLGGARTHINVNVFYLKRDYLDVQLIGRNDRSRGAYLQLVRDVGPETKIGAAGQGFTTDSLNTPTSKDYHYDVFASHQISPTFNVTLRGSRIVRNGYLPYRAYVGLLTIQKSF